MMGHIIEWYYNGIAGIQIKEPGFGKIVIMPYLPDSMNCFRCSYDSVKGNITVEVEKSRYASIMPSCVFHFYFPGDCCIIRSKEVRRRIIYASGSGRSLKATNQSVQ